MTEKPTAAQLRAALAEQERREATAQVEAEMNARVAELIADLTRPTYNWRMANGILNAPNRSMDWDEDGARIAAMTRSAWTRRARAAEEIELIVSAWFTKHIGV